MENGYYSPNDPSQNGTNDNYGSDRRSKRSNGVTIRQFVVWLLVVALISGVVGAYAAGAFGKDKTPEAPKQDGSGAMIIDGDEETDKSGGAPSTKPSQRLDLAADNGGEVAATTVQTCMSSVVGIYTSASGSAESYFGSNGGGEQDTGAGSGVIVTSDGYIVTNNHVVQGAEHIRVYLQDGTEYQAKLIGRDTYTDLAVIKIEATGLPQATIGSSDSVTVGSTVYAIGNPLGVLTSSVSRGIISGLNRTITIDGVSMTLMQTDAAVNPGNSGGGLFNADGELIGIVNAKTASVEVEGLGFAIPVNSAQPVIVDLIDLGYVSGRPYIGITMQDVAIRYGNDLSSYFFFGNSYSTRVQVMSVEEGGTAEQAGMRANDIITAVNGTEINGSSAFAAKLYEYEIGETVTITVLRGSETVDLSVVLGERS